MNQRDAVIVRTREFLSSADKTDPTTKVISDLMMEMIYQDTEMVIAENAVQHERDRYQRLLQLIKDEIPATRLPYKLFACLSELKEGVPA